MTSCTNAAVAHWQRTERQSPREVMRGKRATEQRELGGRGILLCGGRGEKRETHVIEKPAGRRGERSRMVLTIQESRGGGGKKASTFAKKIGWGWTVNVFGGWCSRSSSGGTMASQ